MNILSCCTDHCALSSSVLATSGSPAKLLKSSLTGPRLVYHDGCGQRRNSLSSHCRVLKIVSYYGLRNPPYKLDALEPYMSQRTLEVHWGAHHRGYVEALNRQLEKNDLLYGCTIDELIQVAYNNGNPLPEFNNAAQVWNHDFFWDSMQPGGGGVPTMGLHEKIEKDFASFSNFKEKFIEAALTSFGSSWIWLVLKREKKCFEIVKTSNAVNPLVWNDIPIISLDMWEHAYYLDYKGSISWRSNSPGFYFRVGVSTETVSLEIRNDKAKYIKTFMDHLVSWNAAAVRLARAQAFVNWGEPKIPVA